MAFNSEGNFTRLHNWEQDRLNDIGIASDRHDEEDNGFADGLNECFLRDGRVTLSGNLKMGDHQIKNLASATSATDGVNKSQLDGAVADVTMDLTLLLNKLWKIGDIKASVKTVNHDNWFLCNGQAVSRVTYADLFEIIGTNFGSGDGTTTFNLPDYRGKFLRGFGGDSAEDIYTTQSEGLPNITGDFSGVGQKYSDIPNTLNGAFFVKNTTNRPQEGASIDNGGEKDDWFGFDASLSNPVYGSSEHVTPVNQAVNYFIKVLEE